MCEFRGRAVPADGAAVEVMEADENPDDAAVEKTGIAVTPLELALHVMALPPLLPLTFHAHCKNLGEDLTTSTTLL